ncbi:MAG: hypothetical protein WBP22_02085 [Candidatus Saccharimonas sp.]
MVRPDLIVGNMVWISDTAMNVYGDRAYTAVQDKLLALGYRLSYDNHADPAAKAGKSVYAYFSPDVARVKCKKCGALSSTKGALVHGKKCEGCDAVIYSDIYPGALVNFTFCSAWVNGPYVWQTVARWDEENGYLYCELALSAELTDANRKNTATLLNSHRRSWDLVMGNDGKQLRRYRYFGRGDKRNGIHNFYCASEPEIGYEDVLYWHGVEYPEDSTDPALPREIRIFKRW